MAACGGDADRMTASSTRFSLNLGHEEFVSLSETPYNEV